MPTPACRTPRRGVTLHPVHPVRAAKELEVTSAHDTLQTAYSTWQYCFTTYTDEDRIEKDAEIAVSEATLAQAQALVDKLGDDGLDEDEVALYEEKIKSAEISVEKAQYAVDNYDTADTSYLMYAPDEGIVTAVNYSAGEVVSNNSKIVTMVNLDETVIEFNLDETDMASIGVGMPVNITFDSLSSKVFTGTITKIYPELYSNFGTAYVQGLITIDPESMTGAEEIVVGMNATVEIISAESLNTLMVPTEALVKQDNGEYAVYVVNNGVPVLTPVTVGLFDITYVEITSGLSMGDQVLTETTEMN